MRRAERFPSAAEALLIARTQESGQGSKDRTAVRLFAPPRRCGGRDRLPTVRVGRLPPVSGVLTTLTDSAREGQDSLK